MKEKKHEAEEK